jgi:aminoglycoside/choline kinase family phosphotransferase
VTFERDTAINDFLAHSGWSAATRAPLAGDASTRRYERLTLNGTPAILMDAPPKAETPSCPPQATPVERAALGYNALARLAAGRVDAFVSIAAWLTEGGFAAPEIYAFDARQGLALLEDLGDDVYATVLAKGGPERELYAGAIETLASLHQREAPKTLSKDNAQWPLLSYDRPAMHAEVNLLTEWWAGTHLGAKLSDAARADWALAWESAFDQLEGSAPVVVLRDFHAENVLWRPNLPGLKRVGLVDFQDALAGHPAYDLVSLLEDARRDVSPELAAAMVDHYIAVAAPADAAAFRAGYAVLGAQRNSKIVGIFARLALRDGKPRFLDLIPRVARHLENDLRHPALGAVASWMTKHLPGKLAQAAAA